MLPCSLWRVAQSTRPPAPRLPSSRSASVLKLSTLPSQSWRSTLPTSQSSAIPTRFLPRRLRLRWHALSLMPSGCDEDCLLIHRSGARRGRSSPSDQRHPVHRAYQRHFPFLLANLIFPAQPVIFRYTRPPTTSATFEPNSITTANTATLPTPPTPLSKSPSHTPLPSRKRPKSRFTPSTAPTATTLPSVLSKASLPPTRFPPRQATTVTSVAQT